MLDLLQNVLIGVLSSLVASLIFLRFLVTRKPSLEISKQISMGTEYGGVSSWFEIKVINRTSTHVMNIKAELHSVVPESKPGGVVMDLHRIELKRDEVFTLGKFDKKDQDAKYAFRFGTLEDLSQLRQDGQSHLVFTIYAVHPVSGFGQVFVQKYEADSIIDGDFRVGDTMEIAER